ncbi:MATE family efflux transporter [Thermovorax subterraneus]|nr:MATE family efflux transporter [Thermovorax subterraneus]
MAKIAELFAPKDMTVGKPWKRIVEFSIPMLIGNVAQQLYNTVDSIIVGRYVGDNALAAVGSAFPVFFFLLVLFVAISTGAGIMVSQYFGAKDREKLSRTIGVCITLTAIASAIIMVISPFVVRPMLALINTPESILDWSAAYLLILLVGNWGFSYFNILSGILRGLGDSLSALVFLLISTALNVVLDIWFVVSFKLGVAGVALATVISQVISAVLCAIKLKRMDNIFDMNFEMLKPLKEYVLQIIKLGIPSGLTQAILSLAMVTVQSLTNSFGELVIAANVMVMRVDGFAMMPNFTFGITMTTYAGQNVGARKLDRVEQGTRQGLAIAVGVSTVITIILLVFGRYLMVIFTQTAELVDLGMRFMRILAVGYVAMAVTQVLSGVMRGAGDTVTPMWISLITTFFLRVPLAYGIAYITRSPSHPNGRPESIFFSLVLAWVFGALINIYFYKKGAWKEKALFGGFSQEQA